MDELFQFAEINYYSRGIHQKLKHEFIKTYLNIWVENVGKGAIDKIPTVDFFDLFAATGKVRCDDTGEIWDGSALIAAKALAKYPKGRLLFLNSYDPDDKKRHEQLDILQKELEEALDKCPQLQQIKRMISSENINKSVEIALTELNKNFPSVWILDPDNPKHLPWKVVEKIATTIGEPFGIKEERKKPELIINLMTSTLQRTINKAPHIFTKVIGLPESEWRELYEKYERKYHENNVEDCTRHVILDIYADRLSTLYENPPVISLIPTAYGNIIYSMILCTDSKAGYYLMQKRKKEFEMYKIYEWKEEVMKIRDPFQKSFSDFKSC